MEFRKLIQFGGNSFVISLPKKWIVANNLEKGDSINVDIQGTKLILFSEQEKITKEKIEIIIEIDKNSTDAMIERKLFSAYVNGATKIIFSGLDLKKHSDKITDLLKKYVALEIVEHTTNKIICKTYISSEEIKISSFIRRVDNTIRSMLIDLEENSKFEKCSDENVTNIFQREENIDRIRRMLYRVITERLKNPFSDKEENALENLKYWEMIKNLEKISNQIKYLCVNLVSTKKINKNEKEYNDLMIKKITETKTLYEEIMKNFYKHELNESDVCSQKIKEIKKEINENCCSNNKEGKQLLLNILECMRDINRLIY